MSRKVFVSFRYRDGHKYKEMLDRIFDESTKIINCSEDINRSQLSEESIKRYLYNKLSNTSVTVIIITPESVNYQKSIWTGAYDDWIYDEVRYSLEDRVGNRTNGLVAVYTEEAKSLLMNVEPNGRKTIHRFDNLVYENMMNIKPQYKANREEGVFDSRWDSYCSLISWNDFISNYGMYIDDAAQKRDIIDRYMITKRM